MMDRVYLPGLADYEDAGADFDESRTYRYRLWRIWGGGTLTPWRYVLWIMLNPSTADEQVLDPTLRRVENFSKAWGFDGFEVVNLFALRSTDPTQLAHHPDPVGPFNDHMIIDAANDTDQIICAWGSHPFAKARIARVRELLLGHELFCLGCSKVTGEPAHPLYLPKTTKLEPL